MLDTIMGGMTVIATVLGFLVLAWAAVCILCLMAFTIIMTVDHIQVERAKNARHEKGTVQQTEDYNSFLESLQDVEPVSYIPDDHWAGPATTGSIKLPQPQSIAERKAQDAKIAEQRARVGYSPTPPRGVSHEDMTAVYPAYNPEHTMVGETPRYSTPSDGVQLVAGEEMLHPYQYPFNMEDNNDAPRDRSA